MTTAICTLFEKDYHHGLAVLVNSLIRNGFGGQIYAGYRGELPAWAAGARAETNNRWSDLRVLRASGGCEVVFVRLQTDDHFTNIKPNYMLDLLSQESFKIDALFYLDPDICVTREWQFFEDWITCGIALCEDVNSPVYENHPRRLGWRRYFAPYGISLDFRTWAYVNGGCVGVVRSQAQFLEKWQKLSSLMAEVIGGLGAAKIEGGTSIRRSGFASCFDCSDQDALNAAIEACNTEYSILAQSAMAFAPGGTVLPHALGPRKPWRRRYIRESLGGRPPTAADKAYWEHADKPLCSMSSGRIRSSRLSLRIASALGRVYRRS